MDLLTYVYLCGLEAYLQIVVDSFIGDLRDQGKV